MTISGLWRITKKSLKIVFELPKELPAAVSAAAVAAVRRLNLMDPSRPRAILILAEEETRREKFMLRRRDPTLITMLAEQETFFRMSVFWLLGIGFVQGSEMERSMRVLTGVGALSAMMWMDA